MDMIKSLTEAQCGSQAPMVALSNNFAQSKFFMMPENFPLFTSYNDQLTSEYLRHFSAESTAPNSFDMSAILQQYPPSSNESVQLMQRSMNQNSALMRKWCSEYERSLNDGQSSYANDRDTVAGHTSPSTKSLTMNDVWSPIGHQSTVQPIGNQFFNFGFSSIQRQPQQQPADTWASNFLERFDVAATTTSTVTDSIVTADDSTISEPINAETWVNEFLASAIGDDIDATLSGNSDYKETNNDAYKIFSRYEAEWNRMSATSAEQYKFNEENAFANKPNLLGRAKQFFAEGNITDAVLCYEAVLQQNPNDAETWCSLGLCHAENEQDGEAIAAFRRSMELDPLNRRTLLASAVSLANEGADMAAMRHLDQWLHQFCSVDAATASDAYVDDAFVMGETWAKQLNDKFLAATSMPGLSSARVAELHNALAIFYNLTQNYAKAVEAMRTAISIDQADAVMWNRLGASLANDDRSPEAIGAYRKALELSPAYVRARYNLGVSCMNMNSFCDAIGHFLSALQLQKNRQNSEIWSKLRSCVLRTSSASSFDDTSRWIGDALDAVEARDINAMIHAYERALHAL